MTTYSYGRQTIESDDIQAVVDTLKSDYLTQGPKIQEFEEKLCQITGAKYAVVVSSGTDALPLRMLALGIGPDDTGLTSPMTFAASANCLRYVGAGVEFADIDPTTGLIDSEQIEKNITRTTRVLIPVHYAGQSADMQEIRAIAKKHKLFVVEDAAHALGSSYRGHPVGSCYYSDLTTFSFHPVKTITTGEGGAITTNSKKLYDRLLTLRTHGIIKLSNIAPWYYEMRELGYNYRLSDISAALGIAQLSKLPRFITKRQALTKEYLRLLAGIPAIKPLAMLPNRSTVLHLFPVLIDFDKLTLSKKDFFRQMAKQSINLQVHYLPVHLQPYYQKLGFSPRDFPRSQEFSLQEISLPLYPSLANKDIHRIISVLTNLCS